MFFHICEQIIDFHETVAEQWWKIKIPIKLQLKLPNTVFGSKYITKKLLELLIFIIVHNLTKSNVCHKKTYGSCRFSGK